MSDEKEVKKTGKDYVCITPCFRNGRRFRKGDIWEDCPFKTAPKHFQGYNPEEDPEAPKEEESKAGAKSKKGAAQPSLPGTDGK